MSKGRKWTLGVLGCAVFFCGLCGLGGYGVFHSFFGKAAGSLPAQLEGAKREGLPLTPDDLRALNRVQPEDNAAPQYRKAFALMKDPRFKRKVEEAAAGAGPLAKPEKRAGALAALSALEPVISAAKAAASKSGCSFGYAWEQGFSLSFPEFGDLRTLGKLLCLQGEAEAAAGWTKEAFRTLGLARNLSVHAGAEATLISMLVHISLEAMVDHSAQQVLASRSRDPSTIAAARRFFDSFGPPGDFRRSLSGELVLGRVGIRSLNSVSEITALASDGETPKALPFERQLMRSQTVKDAFEARHVEIYREVFRDLPTQVEEWERAVEVMKRIEAKVDSDSSASGLLNKITMPVFTEAAAAVAQQLARRRVSQCAVRLLEIRLRGSLPERLPNWGSLSIDPFTGGSLVYRRQGGGFLVYSVGRDRTDDGGARTSAPGAGRDVVARFP